MQCILKCLNFINNNIEHKTLKRLKRKINKYKILPVSNINWYKSQNHNLWQFEGQIVTGHDKNVHVTCIVGPGISIKH